MRNDSVVILGLERGCYASLRTYGGVVLATSSYNHMKTRHRLRKNSVVMDRVSPRPFYRNLFEEADLHCKCLGLELTKEVHGGGSFARISSRGCHF